MDVAHKGQRGLLILLLLLFFGAMGVLINFDPSIFKRFFGHLNPWLVTVLAAMFGYMALNVLSSNYGFAINRLKSLKPLIPYISTVPIFVAVSIFVDLKMVFPEDMNIPFPESLLFYPAIGFLVEVVFHVIPVVNLVYVLNLAMGKIAFQHWTWVSPLLVAMLEPTYQIYMDPYPLWGLLAVWANLFLFNCLQLFVLYRFDFVAMFILRLVYYLIWHVLWGALRLEVLF